MKLLQSFAVLLGLGSPVVFGRVADGENSAISVRIELVAVEEEGETTLLQATVGSVKCFEYDEQNPTKVKETSTLVADSDGFVVFDLDPTDTASSDVQVSCVLDGTVQTAGNILYMPSMIEMTYNEMSEEIVVQASLYPDRVARGDIGESVGRNSRFT